MIVYPSNSFFYVSERIEHLYPVRRICHESIRDIEGVSWRPCPADLLAASKSPFPQCIPQTKDESLLRLLMRVFGTSAWRRIGKPHFLQGIADRDQKQL